jgi:pyruvyltransferase
MGEILMYWYRMRGKKQNFGDVLGPYIVEKITGKKAVYVPVNVSSPKSIVAYFYGILIGRNKFKDLLSLIRSYKHPSILISIGSVIGWYAKSSCNVWGSGIMFKNENIVNANFYAVRGKYTQARLKELGYKVPDTIGDPGLLLPLVFNPIIEKKFKLGIIPHFVHFDKTLGSINDSSVLIINLLDDVEKVVNDLKSCDCTISSSLHGIIESHAYGIPSLWYNLPGDKLAGDNIKFLDYFSSVGIKNYEPYHIKNYNSTEIETIIKEVNANCDIQKILNEIKLNQINLLKVAPFEVLDCYME